MERQWAGMHSLVVLRLQLNNLVGTVPKSWPESFRSLTLTGDPCPCRMHTFNWTTTSTLVRCKQRTFIDLCIHHAVVQLLGRAVTPLPVDESNPWNWNSSNVYFGPQRNDCQTRRSLTTTVSSSLRLFSTACRPPPQRFGWAFVMSQPPTHHTKCWSKLQGLRATKGLPKVQKLANHGSMFPGRVVQAVFMRGIRECNAIGSPNRKPARS